LAAFNQPKIGGWTISRQE